MTGALRAAEHNAQTKKDNELLTPIRAALSILHDCERQFVAPQQATPSTIKRLCLHLYDRLSEVDGYFEQIRKAKAELPEGAHKRTLLYTEGRYAKMVELLNLYLQDEGK